MFIVFKWKLFIILSIDVQLVCVIVVLMCSLFMLQQCRGLICLCYSSVEVQFVYARVVQMFCLFMLQIYNLFKLLMFSLFKLLMFSLSFISDHLQEMRCVLQYHYNGWPDHGVPESPGPILELIDNLPQLSPNNPLCIHCRQALHKLKKIIYLHFIFTKKLVCLILI